MHIQRILLTEAVLAALASFASVARAEETINTLPEVIVTATPFQSGENMQIFAPASILRGDELRNKLGGSLGDTLANEPGVSASGFGAGSSRPIIRGLGGPRVRVLQNGMGVADVSTVSEDHAVGTEISTARQIEILRGPATLLYGSGAIGGLVNIVNDRIPTMLEQAPTGEAEIRHGTADKSTGLSLSADGAVGKLGLHLDGSVNDAGDYKIPGFAQAGNPDSASGRLPLSYNRQNSLGFGASHIESWGHVGASIGTLDHRYGVPSEEGARIELKKTRYDVDTLLKRPFEGFESLRVKLGYTDYRHTELDPESAPETYFTQKSLESRWELTHTAWNGWRGTFGIQTEHDRFLTRAAQADDVPTIPETKSRSFAGFIVEEKDFGPVRLNAGLRLESVRREPVAGLERSFRLASHSLGGLWTFAPGYSIGPTFSVAQRAPTTEELYSGGAHHATETFDRGDAALGKETSRNIELTLQKTDGPVRWKANLFHNRVSNFIYGRMTGATLDEEGNPGGNLSERIFSQGDATIRGGEAEISYNLRGEGVSLRAFADTSRGTLENAGNLPLQPATRFGVDIGYKQGGWRSGVSVLRAQRQDRLASFETTPTPAYTRVDANLSYVQIYRGYQLTWFALARNLLNEDIRLSTSLLKDVAPLAGRSLVVGMRTSF